MSNQSSRASSRQARRSSLTWALDTDEIAAQQEQQDQIHQQFIELRTVTPPPALKAAAREEEANNNAAASEGSSGNFFAAASASLSFSAENNSNNAIVPSPIQAPGAAHPECLQKNAALPSSSSCASATATTTTTTTIHQSRPIPNAANVMMVRKLMEERCESHKLRKRLKNTREAFRHRMEQMELARMESEDHFGQMSMRNVKYIDDVTMYASPSRAVRGKAPPGGGAQQGAASSLSASSSLQNSRRGSLQQQQQQQLPRSGNASPDDLSLVSSSAAFGGSGEFAAAKDDYHSYHHKHRAHHHHHHHHLSFRNKHTGTAAAAGSGSVNFAGIRRFGFAAAAIQNIAEKENSEHAKKMLALREAGAAVPTSLAPATHGLLCKNQVLGPVLREFHDQTVDWAADWKKMTDAAVDNLCFIFEENTASVQQAGRGILRDPKDDFLRELLHTAEQSQALLHSHMQHCNEIVHKALEKAGVQKRPNNNGDDSENNNGDATGNNSSNKARLPPVMQMAAATVGFENAIAPTARSIGIQVGTNREEELKRELAELQAAFQQLQRSSIQREADKDAEIAKANQNVERLQGRLQLLHQCLLVQKDFATRVSAASSSSSSSSSTNTGTGATTTTTTISINTSDVIMLNDKAASAVQAIAEADADAEMSHEIEHLAHALGGDGGKTVASTTTSSAASSSSPAAARGGSGGDVMVSSSSTSLEAATTPGNKQCALHHEDPTATATAATKGPMTPPDPRPSQQQKRSFRSGSFSSVGSNNTTPVDSSLDIIADDDDNNNNNQHQQEQQQQQQYFSSQQQQKQTFAKTPEATSFTAVPSTNKDGEAAAMNAFRFPTGGGDAENNSSANNSARAGGAATSSMMPSKPKSATRRLYPSTSSNNNNNVPPLSKLQPSEASSTNQQHQPQIVAPGTSGRNKENSSSLNASKRPSKSDATNLPPVVEQQPSAATAGAGGAVNVANSLRRMEDWNAQQQQLWERRRSQLEKRSSYEGMIKFSAAQANKNNSNSTQQQQLYQQHQQQAMMSSQTNNNNNNNNNNVRRASNPDAVAPSFSGGCAPIPVSSAPVPFCSNDVLIDVQHRNGNQTAARALGAKRR